MIWNKSYETGNEKIDSDHKELFRSIEKVLEASVKERKEVFDETIEFLSKYVKRHFEMEQGLMKQSSYPDMQNHINAHNSFAKKINEIRLSNGKSFKNSAHLREVLVDWLVAHVMSADKKFAKYYAPIKIRK